MVLTTQICNQNTILLYLFIHYLVSFYNEFQYDGLERLVKDSEMLQRAYKHLFDITIINEDIDDTLNELEHALEIAHTTPQWIPVAWVY